jgi:hypothetical protein
MKRIFAAVIGLVGFTGWAAAQAPVAVVEDVQGKVTGVEFMDYVAPGKVIKLGPAGMVVLGYMKSCWRETITGVEPSSSAPRRAWSISAMSRPARSIATPTTCS